MKRREFITFTAAAVTSPLAAHAQEPGRTYRLGALFPSARNAPQMLAVFEELQRSGFSEGQNLAAEWRVYGSALSRFRNLRQSASGPTSTSLSRAGTSESALPSRQRQQFRSLALRTTWPGLGWSHRWRAPPANTTGVSLLAADLDGKRQEILIEAVPGLPRMAAFADTETTLPRQLDTLREAACARGIELSISEDITPTLDRAKASNIEAVNVLASPLLFANRRMFIERTAELRSPAIYQWPEVAEEGGLIGYGPRSPSSFGICCAGKS